MRFLIAVIVMVLAVVLVSFALQNSGTDVDVTCSGTRRVVELPVVVFLCLLVGATASDHRGREAR